MLLRNMSHLPSGSNVTPNKKLAWKLCFPPAFKTVSCFTHSSNPNMEAKCSSETSVYLRRATQHCIPDDRTVRSHRCQNVKSNNRTHTCPSLVIKIHVEQFIHSAKYVIAHVPSCFRNVDDIWHILVCTTSKNFMINFCPISIQ